MIRTLTITLVRFFAASSVLAQNGPGNGRGHGFRGGRGPGNASGMRQPAGQRGHDDRHDADREVFQYLL